MGGSTGDHYQQQRKKKADDEEGMHMKQKVDDHHAEMVPKGCMAVMVGHEGEEEQKRRFVIPVIYIYHPLFMDLLKEAEEEYGFHHSGPINIPCDVQQFSNLQGLIKKDDHFFYHHHHIYWCFKA